MTDTDKPASRTGVIILKPLEAPGVRLETRTVNVQCVDVLKDEHLLVLKGQLPGSKNSLVEVRLSHRG